jgi:divalent metal cation (Fe/Co/Zn/Cd) transporter
VHTITDTAAGRSAARASLIRRAFALEGATIAWMLIEAGVAIGAGVAAGSILLLAFGLDSVIELISAGVLIWRLSVELRHGRAFSETAERRAARIAGALLFALAVYVVASAAWSLWTAHRPDASPLGLAVTILAIPLMYLLARRKIAVAEALGSRAMRADAVESITCGYLAAIVLVGLIADLLTGWRWVDPVASLGIVWFLIKEGREAWSGDSCCAHCD